MRRFATALAAAIMATTSAAADYLVKEVGSFHVGGHTETLNGLPSKEIVFSPGAPPIKVDPNGEFEVEQMYVQFVKLAQPKSKLPLLLWHGGGLSGVTWETKPDGKPGWQQFFLNAGYDVYVSDAVERGRASWARYPEIFKSEPFFRPKKEAWELFRIGPSYEVGGKREAFEGEQFPIEAFDQFAKQGIPRWSTNDAATQKAYDALVQKVCPCIIVVHSQGGNFGFTAALNAPDKVKALMHVFEVLSDPVRRRIPECSVPREMASGDSGGGDRGRVRDHAGGGVAASQGAARKRLCRRSGGRAKTTLFGGCRGASGGRHMDRSVQELLGTEARRAGDRDRARQTGAAN